MKYKICVHGSGSFTSTVRSDHVYSYNPSYLGHLITPRLLLIKTCQNGTFSYIGRRKLVDWN
jgi:hypothetical protein